LIREEGRRNLRFEKVMKSDGGRKKKKKKAGGGGDEVVADATNRSPNSTPAPC
jgi:hypothetical protein